MSAALDHMAARVERDPAFLASALAEYARSEKLDDAGLAAELGLPPADLARLRLCGSPRAEHFLADVAAVAQYFNVDATTLAGVVRRGQSLARLRAAHSAESQPGLLLAARDDARDPPPASEGQP
jgi:hypothetical protein